MAQPSVAHRSEPEGRGSEPNAAGAECRLATLADLESITAFTRLAAGVVIPPAYWRWRYFDNPAGPSGIVVALDEGRIVGLMSAFAVAFRLGDQQLVASQMEHNEILPSHRSAGLFFRLANTLVRELLPPGAIDFCLGIAIRETRDLSTVLMGFDEVAPICKLVGILNPVAHLRKSWRLPLPRLLGRPLAWWRRLGVERALRGFESGRFDHFSEVAGAGWQPEHERQLIASREASFLEWRYVRCPLAIYDRLQLRLGGEPVGWAVCHIFEEHGVRYGVLDECFASPAIGLEPVVNLVIGSFLDRDVDAIVAWSPPATGLHRALRGAGLAPRPSQRSLIVRGISGRVPASILASEASWYYTVGDSEYWLFPTRQGRS